MTNDWCGSQDFDPLSLEKALEEMLKDSMPERGVPRCTGSTNLVTPKEKELWDLWHAVGICPLAMLSKEIEKLEAAQGCSVRVLLPSVRFCPEQLLPNGMSITYDICESNCPCIHGYTSWYICV